MTPSPLILDTCVLLWLLSGDDRVVKNRALMTLLNERVRFFCPVSIAEIEIKKSIGKLKTPDNYIDCLLLSGLKELPYTSHDCLSLSTLPFHHKDPFDRMVISAAMNNGMTLVTADEVFRKYPVNVFLI